MPGMFGALGGDPAVWEQLSAHWQAVWPDCQQVRFPNGIIGGHAYRGGAALRKVGIGRWLAVDGEYSIYRRMEDLGQDEAPLLVETEEGELTLIAETRGNVALLNPEDGLLALGTEWTGTFPLYFALFGEGLAFSSLLRPLAKALAASPDPVAVVQFLRTAHICGGRSLFEGVRRIQPGQSLWFRVGQGLRVREHSRLWAESDSGVHGPHEAAEILIPLLRSALQDSLREEVRSLLMMSAGWDSRVLLGLASSLAAPGNLMGYSHGDTDSREIHLARMLCEAAGVPHHRYPIDAAALDPKSLWDDFGRAESAVFPHWLASSKRAHELGAEMVFSGVLGEVMGGHYGETMILRGSEKIVAFLKASFSTSGELALDPKSLEKVENLFRVQSLGNPWYFEQSFLDDRPGLLNAINHDTGLDLQRLERRGVPTLPRLIEAFITEHRGAQYINAQILSSRSRVDVAVPFADRNLLMEATRTPMACRLHNRINRSMMRQMDPGLLRFPLAATLAPAGAPILVQEMSRVLRKLYEEGRWKLHNATGGKVARPRLSWVDFEFLRDGEALSTLIDHLRADLWNRDSMRGLVLRIRSGKRRGNLHPVFDQFGKILTVDLMVR